MHTKLNEFIMINNSANRVNISPYAHLNKLKANILLRNHHKLYLKLNWPKLIWQQNYTPDVKMLITFDINLMTFG